MKNTLKVIMVKLRKHFVYSKIVIFATESLNDVDQEIKSELLD